MTDSESEPAVEPAPDDPRASYRTSGGTQSGPVMMAQMPQTRPPSPPEPDVPPSPEELNPLSRRRSRVRLLASGAVAVLTTVAGVATNAVLGSGLWGVPLFVLACGTGFLAVMVGLGLGKDHPSLAIWIDKHWRRLVAGIVASVVALVLLVLSQGDSGAPVRASSANSGHPAAAQTGQSLPTARQSLPAAEPAVLPRDLRPAAGQTAIRLVFQPGQSRDVPDPKVQDPALKTAVLGLTADGRFLVVPYGNGSTFNKHLFGDKTKAELFGGKMGEAANTCPHMGMGKTSMSVADLTEHVLCISLADGRRALLQVEQVTPGGQVTVLVVVSSSGWPLPAKSSHLAPAIPSSSPSR
ncbi:hypothetical protein [Staphylococcus capitis]|uniref:hypothetical protein n=1 Tax=Staphylococcus capitis TaxID=29388 RepID=UPI003D00301E